MFRAIKGLGQKAAEIVRLPDEIKTLRKEISTLRVQSSSIRDDVDDLAKATELLIRSEEKKLHIKRAAQLKADFERRSLKTTKSRSRGAVGHEY